MNILKEYYIGENYIRYAVSDTPVPHDFNFHVHDKCEIYYFIEGKAQSLIEASVYDLRKGSLMIMRPGEAHSIRILEQERYARYAVNFPMSFFDAFDPKRTLMRPYTERELGKENMFFMPGLESVFEEITAEGLSEYDRSVVLNTKLAYLLDQINREYFKKDRKKTTSSSFAGQAVGYVNRIIFSDISVAELADRFYMSKASFCRMFKEATGATPWEYITAKRLVAARSMILAGSSAGEAAEKCGFGDYSSFYRAYKKRFGTSPYSSEGRK